ncbi:MAG: (2Fe-2S)-binding protein [Chloroflexi bacterium]|nr:(2Fe-2S)-binding protein [Chloroflexota bacterium]
MPKIRILPLDREIDAQAGQTIMAAALASGLYWPTTCGGQAICTTCLCRIEAGAENLDEIGRTELKTMTEERPEAMVRENNLRLACQARVSGDVTVNKRGVREES